ncbi:Sec63 [Podochytrium sp. JEL0797]|nr:Sec63 [Podochytrium sp. JEL0797]
MDWTKLVSATPRDSRAVRRSSTGPPSGSEDERRSSEAFIQLDICGSSPLSRDVQIVSAIKQTPTCLLRPKQFFVGACGVLNLAFAGFPDPVVSLKTQWESIKSVNMAEEMGNSKWPMVALGALASEDQKFSYEQLEALTSLSKKISIRLKKITESVTVSAVSYVIFSSKSLEKIVFRADIPLHVCDEPVDYIPDDQKSVVEQYLRNADEVKVYLKEVNRPGNRIQVYRSYCSETILVVFVAQFKEVMEVIAEFKRAVDKLLPGYYVWFEKESLHSNYYDDGIDSDDEAERGFATPPAAPHHDYGLAHQGHHPPHPSETPPRTHTRPQAPLRAVAEVAGELSLVSDMTKLLVGDHARAVFSFRFFNAMQSRCFDTVYKSDNNLVLSAPTGCGKTCIMELAILRLLAKPGSDQAKIIYVAPTKALCSERVLDWKKKFRTLGLSCGELTGDTDAKEVREVQQSNIIVTTPEKWDSMTRRWRDYKQLMELVQLILIDEVHLLNEPRRGAVLEVIVSRMRTVNAECVMNQHQRSGSGGAARNPKLLRIVAISATAPNIDDIAVWLKNSDGRKAEIQIFGEEYRPVQLMKHVIGFPSRMNTSEFQFDKALDYKLAETIARYSNRKPTLVFCSTRKSVESSATQLVTEASACTIGINHPYIRSRLHETELLQLSRLVADKKLAEYLPHGIAIHYGSLTQQDRTYVESKFIAGKISVICTTSTLSVGVNLPAHLVIIKGTQQYRDTGYFEYSELDIMQMMGRAGRPQFDDSGVAVIMTKTENLKKYQDLVTGKEIIESSLHENLIEHLNAEVVLGTILNLELCIEWLKSTFLNVRISKNPSRYKDPRQKPNAQQQNMSLETICMKDLNLLADAKLIEQRDDGMTVLPTDFGRVMARYYVRFETAKEMIGLQKAPSVKRLLECLSSSVELSELKFRNDKTYLNEINKLVKYPLAGKVKTVGDRVNLLIQCALGSIKFTDQKLAGMLTLDSNVILKHAERLSRFLFEVSQLKQDFQATDASLELANAIHAKAWEQNGHHLKQIESIGPVQAKMLFDGGVKTVRDFLGKSPEQIEILLNRGRLTGNKLLDSTKALPLLKLDVSVLQLFGQHEVEFHAVLTLENPTLAKTMGKRGPINAVFFAGTEYDSQLLEFRKIPIRDLQKPQKLIIKFKKRPTPSKIKFVAAVEEYVGLTVSESTTISGAGPTATGNLASGPLPIAPVFKQAGAKANSNLPTAKATAKRSFDDDDEFPIDSDDEAFFSSVAVDDAVMGRGGSGLGASGSGSGSGEVVEQMLSGVSSKKRKGAAGAEKPVIPSVALMEGRVSCKHACARKDLCEHLCCKNGVKPSKRKPKAAPPPPKQTTPTRPGPSSSTPAVRKPPLRPKYIDDSSESDEVPLAHNYRHQPKKPRVILPLTTVISSDSENEFKSSEDLLKISKPVAVDTGRAASPIVLNREMGEEKKGSAVNDDFGDVGMGFDDDYYDEWADYEAEADQEGVENEPESINTVNDSARGVSAAAPPKDSPPLFSDSDPPEPPPAVSPSYAPLTLPPSTLPTPTVAGSKNKALDDLNALHMKTISSSSSKPWLRNSSNTPTPRSSPAPQPPLSIDQRKEMRDLSLLHESTLQDTFQPPTSKLRQLSQQSSSSAAPIRRSNAAPPPSRNGGPSDSFPLHSLSNTMAHDAFTRSARLDSPGSRPVADPPRQPSVHFSNETTIMKHREPLAQQQPTLRPEMKPLFQHLGSAFEQPAPPRLPRDTTTQPSLSSQSLSNPAQTPAVKLETTSFLDSWMSMVDVAPARASSLQKTPAAAGVESEPGSNGSDVGARGGDEGSGGGRENAFSMFASFMPGLVGTLESGARKVAGDGGVGTNDGGGGGGGGGGGTKGIVKDGDADAARRDSTVKSTHTHAACTAIARLRRTANQHAQMAANLEAQARVMEDFLAAERPGSAGDRRALADEPSGDSPGGFPTNSPGAFLSASSSASPAGFPHASPVSSPTVSTSASPRTTTGQRQVTTRPISVQGNAMASISTSSSTAPFSNPNASILAARATNSIKRLFNKDAFSHHLQKSFHKTTASQFSPKESLPALPTVPGPAIVPSLKYSDFLERQNQISSQRKSKPPPIISQPSVLPSPPRDVSETNEKPSVPHATGFQFEQEDKPRPHAPGMTVLASPPPSGAVTPDAGYATIPTVSDTGRAPSASGTTSLRRARSNSFGGAGLDTALKIWGDSSNG